jgi:serine/threonine-protein kinase
MSDSTSSDRAADRNLLFAVLALQADLIEHDRFVEACSAWVSQKNTPLADLLVQGGWLTPEDRAEVDKLLQRKLAKHNGDSRASLAEVASEQIRQSLAGLTDTDLRASVSAVTPPPVGHILVSTTDNVTEVRERYALTRLHATGGIGRVWLAHDQSLGRDVALKELRPERATRPELRARFLREARVTGQLEHPGVVPIYEVGRRPDDRAPFYTMRFVRGRTLAEAIAAYHVRRLQGEAGPLELRGLLTAFVGVCNAVGYAHSRGVIHRDLKPQNVVLGDYGEAIVLDWGLARILDAPDAEEVAQPPLDAGPEIAATMQGQALGTPAYMAPEQAEGRLDLFGPRTDVYGLGAVLYEILTGRPPYVGDDTTALLRQVIHGEPLRPRTAVERTPAALEAVCLKALAKRPSERYESAKELAAEVERWMADEPVAVYRERWPTRLGRWARRHKPVVSAAAALLLTAVGGLGIGVVAVAREQSRTQAALVAEGQRRHQARLALDAMSSEIIDEWLGKQKELLPEHKAFLQKAVASYEEFAQDTRQDEESRSGVAAASRRVGNIYWKLGQAREAEAAYRRSVDGFGQLAVEFVDHRDLRYELAKSHTDLGVLLAATGRPDQAETAFNDALSLYKNLSAGSSGNADYRSALATVYHRLSHLMADTGRFQPAEKASRDALEINKQLATDFPDRPEFRQELADCYNHMAYLLVHTGRLQDAVSSLRDGITMLRQLVADEPNRSDFRFDLARGHNNLGLLLKDAGSTQQAEAAYRDALPIYKQLAADFPARPEFREQLANSYNNLGVLLTDTSRPREAEAAYRDALTLYRRLAADFPTVPQYQAICANTLSGLAEVLHGDHDDAAASRLLDESLPLIQAALRTNARQPLYRSIAFENLKLLARVRLGSGAHTTAASAAEELLGYGSDPAKDAYTAGSLFAQCSLAAKSDASLPQTRRAELALGYENRAITLLRQAISQGYSETSEIKKSKDLDPLRGREDFNKLLADLESKASKDEKGKK